MKKSSIVNRQSSIINHQSSIIHHQSIIIIKTTTSLLIFQASRRIWRRCLRSNSSALL